MKQFKAELPEKYHRPETAEQEDINQIIDYLAERKAPSFSEAYKNKTEEQMLDVARIAVAEQQASVSTPLFKADDVRVIQWTDMGMACGGWKIEITKDWLTEAEAEQAREALLRLTQ